ncbi:retron St85 family RNA-directed DNA polymerase [Proteus penneri]|uniref:retron St85 family RNA-directed DNA polymerase n=1 Tax=Proteus penneri TaxID=102862 RepID=UPI0020986707|nr:retron St85 family RNA-directed DNA polymerase [Proteus penneri]MCO8051998.1 retron St85 family RNA-directed DNA polymerase [Proteus penneri]
MTNLKQHLLTSTFINKEVLKILASSSRNTTHVDIEEWLLLSIAKVITSGPKMYKVYTIPKRNGGKRTIAHPSKVLKVFQRGIIEFLTDKLPIHNSAYAYKKNISIKDNALQHVSHSYFLKMDLADFFNSIDVDLFEKQIERHKIILTDEDITLLRRCIFWSPKKTSLGNLILSVGAPSSPLISNFIMFSFDEIVTTICNSLEIKYTRYADDMFFSTNKKDILFKIPNLIKYILFSEFNEKIVVNDIKTSFSSKAHNRHLAGITITNNEKLSIGRERKRIISAMIHKYSLGNSSTLELSKLQGLLSFSKHIEPLFVERMEVKYSVYLINKIISGQWRK